MKVKVMHCLTGTFTAVVDYTVAVVESLFLCDHGNDLKDVSNDGTVFGSNVIAPFDVFLGDHENVNGSLRRKILECNDGFVFIYLC